MNEKLRFWFYSGRHAERLARTKAQGVDGAKVLNHEDVKARRLALPKEARGANAAWTWLGVAPAELEPEAEEELVSARLRRPAHGVLRRDRCQRVVVGAFAPP